MPEGRTISGVADGGMVFHLAAKLARAVLLLHKEGGLSPADFAAWQQITGSHVITISVLRKLADAVLDAERAAEREGVRV